MTGVGAVFYRDYRQRMTNIGFVFWDLFVPLAYLVLFGLGFERMLGQSMTVEGQDFSYTGFLVPGVLGMVTFSVAMNTAWGFFMDKDSGIFYELLTYPITRTQLLIGKISFNVLLAVIGSSIVDHTRRSCAGHAGPLGPVAADAGHCNRGYSELVLYVQRVCDQARSNGCIQHGDQCGLHPADVFQLDVLSAGKLACVVPHTGLSESDDVAGRLAEV